MTTLAGPRPLVHPWDTVVFVIEVLLFTYFVLVNAFYLLTAIIAFLRLPWYVKFHMADPVRKTNSTLDQPVSILVPAYNEEEILVNSLRSMLALQYANFEIIVINDGSTDETMARLQDAFELEPYEGVYRIEIPTQQVREIYQSTTHPRIRVIDKINGGKGDALNAGVNLSRYPLLFSTDADSYYHRQTLQWMVEPFQRDRERTVVVGGAIAIADAEQIRAKDHDIAPRLPKKLIQRFQVLEYLRAFLSTRMGYAPLNALGIVSGACGLWKREIIVACGGFRTDTIWEDMEMTLRVHNYCISTGRPYRVAFTPFPVCWTDVPNTLGVLYNQRKGWHRHLSECVLIHRRMLFGSGGLFSWITMPYLVFFEWLAPLVVVFGILFMTVAGLLGWLNWYANWWLLGLVFVLSLFGSIASILLDEMSYTSYRLSDVWELFLAALIENFGFRQFVMIANLSGFFAWLFKRPIRGRTSYPGLFVRAWRPHKADS